MHMVTAEEHEAGLRADEAELRAALQGAEDDEVRDILTALEVVEQELARLR